MKTKHLCSSLLIFGLLTITSSAVAQQQPVQSFSDVPPDHPVYQAAEYLRSQGIISGYDDGTFKPDQKVNRAEALKIIIAPLVAPGQLEQITGTVYEDIGQDAWYLPYVEIARQNGIVDGPPKKTNFLGGNTVITVEFLKILQVASQVDPQSFLGEIRLPLSTDVSNPDEWFYPYMRYAIASSMIMISTDGLLHPGAELKRGDAAMLLFRFLMYQQERRSQALLSEAESEMIITLSTLEDGNIDQAVYSSARALLAARGAHFKRPNDPITKGAVKITEAFRALVEAYRAGRDRNYSAAVDAAGSAWNLAARAQELSENLATISEQVQIIAKNMADSARELMDNQPEQ